MYGKTIDFTVAETLIDITNKKAYTLPKNISEFKLIEITMQFGTTNFISTRYYRPSLLSSLPEISDSVKTSKIEAYYHLYIKGKDVNVSDLTANTRMLIRGIK